MDVSNFEAFQSIFSLSIEFQLLNLLIVLPFG